jgi:hypothetical protein
MRDLTGTCDPPAVSVVMGLANRANFYATGVTGLYFIQAIRTGMFYLSDKFDLFNSLFLNSVPSS